jgi:hypothetical protein
LVRPCLVGKYPLAAAHHTGHGGVVVQPMQRVFVAALVALTAAAAAIHDQGRTLILFRAQLEHYRKNRGEFGEWVR